MTKQTNKQTNKHAKKERRLVTYKVAWCEESQNGCVVAVVQRRTNAPYARPIWSSPRWHALSKKNTACPFFLPVCVVPFVCCCMVGDGCFLLPQHHKEEEKRARLQKRPPGRCDAHRASLQAQVSAVCCKVLCVCSFSPAFLLCVEPPFSVSTCLLTRRRTKMGPKKAKHCCCCCCCH